MDTEVENLYKTTVDKMKIILQSAKKMPGEFIKTQLKTLKTEVAMEIRRIKPGVLEKHLEKKQQPAITKKKPCASCKN
jgi:hypothetical protein